MAALAVAPHREAVRRAGIRQRARGAHQIEHGASLADADQIGVDPRRAEAGIVGGDHHVVLGQHLRQPPDHAVIVGHERRRAGLDHAAGGMGPGDHVAAAGWGRPRGEMNGAGDLDGLAVQSGRAIEDAEGFAVAGAAAVERPDPDDRSRLPRPKLLARRRYRRKAQARPWPQAAGKHRSLAFHPPTDCNGAIIASTHGASATVCPPAAA